jgi:hypothetical protein
MKHGPPAHHAERTRAIRPPCQRWARAGGANTGGFLLTRRAGISSLTALCLLGVTQLGRAQETGAEPPEELTNTGAIHASPLDVAPSAQGSRDDFEVFARSRTTVGGFQRALLPGPGGAIVTTQTLAPLHEAVSLSATRVDTPLGKDGLDLQLAAYGQFWAGQPENQTDATWDIATAMVTQRIGDVAISLGRQTVSGGAARYRRFDGAAVRAATAFGLHAAAYGGFTALPRWDQWYGTHALGDAYEQWSAAPDSIVVPTRGENWMGGFNVGWQDERIGGVGVSFHHQAENQSLADQALGANVRLGGASPVSFVADAIFSLAQRSWSDVRASLDWLITRNKKSGFALAARGELLRVLPSTLLSQASVLSVFSFSEVTELGGAVDIELPLAMRVGLSGYGQAYADGAPGARLAATYQILTGHEGQTLLRFVASRVLLEENGYVQLRVAGRFPLWSRFTAYADVYQYFYDDPIRGHDTSTFAAAHLGYRPAKVWNARLGGSASQSPDAALDLQVLAQLELCWDKEVR